MVGSPQVETREVSILVEPRTAAKRTQGRTRAGGAPPGTVPSAKKVSVAAATTTTTIVVVAVFFSSSLGCCFPQFSGGYAAGFRTVRTTAAGTTFRFPEFADDHPQPSDQQPQHPCCSTRQLIGRGDAAADNAHPRFLPVGSFI